MCTIHKWNHENWYKLFSQPWANQSNKRIEIEWYAPYAHRIHQYQLALLKSESFTSPFVQFTLNPFNPFQIANTTEIQVASNGTPKMNTIAHVYLFDSGIGANIFLSEPLKLNSATHKESRWKDEVAGEKERKKIRSTYAVENFLTLMHSRYADAHT